LFKFSSTGSGKSDDETAIKQVIDAALVSNKVVDIFDAAGIKKPDCHFFDLRNLISILSEEFLLKIQGMEHKNVAIEEKTAA
jgi:type I restriction enzyme R subunit